MNRLLQFRLRRLKRQMPSIAAYVDQSGMIHFRPTVLCPRALTGWKLVPKTLSSAQPL